MDDIGTGNQPAYPQVSLSGRQMCADIFHAQRMTVMGSGRRRQSHQYAVCPGQDHLKSSTNTHNLTTRRCRQNKTQPASATLRHPCPAHPSQGSFAKLPLISCACSHQMELGIPVTYKLWFDKKGNHRGCASHFNCWLPSGHSISMGIISGALRNKAGRPGATGGPFE